jgi:hypothetical protein
MPRARRPIRVMIWADDTHASAQSHVSVLGVEKLRELVKLFWILNVGHLTGYRLEMAEGFAVAQLSCGQVDGARVDFVDFTPPIAGIVRVVNLNGIVGKRLNRRWYAGCPLPTAYTRQTLVTLET